MPVPFVVQSAARSFCAAAPAVVCETAKAGFEFAKTHSVATGIAGVGLMGAGATALVAAYRTDKSATRAKLILAGSTAIALGVFTLAISYMGYQAQLDLERMNHIKSLLGTIDLKMAEFQDTKENYRKWELLGSIKKVFKEISATKGHEKLSSLINERITSFNKMYKDLYEESLRAPSSLTFVEKAVIQTVFMAGWYIFTFRPEIVVGGILTAVAINGVTLKG